MNATPGEQLAAARLDPRSPAVPSVEDRARQVAADTHELLEAVKAWDAMDTLDAVGPTIEAAAALLAAVREVIGVLRQQDDALSAFVGELVPSGAPYPIEGVGALTVRAGTERKAWKHDELIPVVAAAIAEEMGVTHGPVCDVIRAWLEFTGPPSRYRTTQLKPVLAAADLTLDEVCSTTWGAKRAILE